MFFFHKCTSRLIANNHHINAHAKLIERQRERWKGGKSDVSTQCSSFNDAPVSRCCKHSSGYRKHTQTHIRRSPANRNSMSQLFLCLLFISWIPREASKAPLFVSPLTVLCVCHPSLVKIKSHNHTHAHTNTQHPFSQLRIPSGKIIPFRWELFFLSLPTPNWHIWLSS